MILEIPDNVTSQARQEILSTVPIEYALELFNGNKTQAANWLGIGVRTMRDYVRTWDSLSKWRLPPPKMGRYIDRKCK